MSKDYYKILNVDKGASQEEIKKAFRKLAHEHHPDKAHGNEDKFKEANEAYQVLGDPQKRAQYDRFGSSFENGQAGGGFQGFDGFRDFSNFSEGFNVNMEDLGEMFGGLGDIFGFGGGTGRGKGRTRRGADIEVALSIDFLEAAFGVEKEISLNKTVVCSECHGNGAEPGSKIDTCKECNGTGRVVRLQRTILGTVQTQTTCPTCKGEGKTYSQKCKKCNGLGVAKETVNLKVKIPAGIDEGQTIRLAEQGEAGPHGGQAGDLYLQIRIKPTTQFKREGFNIVTDLEIGFSQAALGGKFEIKTIDGIVTLKIPDGTQSGKVFVLKEHGIPKLQSRGRGDHLVRVIVKTPTNLSREQRKLLENLNA